MEHKNTFEKAPKIFESVKKINGTFGRKSNRGADLKRTRECSWNIKPLNNSGIAGKII